MGKVKWRPLQPRQGKKEILSWKELQPLALKPKEFRGGDPHYVLT